MQLKRSREESKNFDIMDNIICSLLISLLLPADTPSYTVIENNASGYLNLLKIVQSRGSHPHTKRLHLGGMEGESEAVCGHFTTARGCGSGGGGGGGGVISESTAQERLNQFRNYLLYDETSFVDALRDSKKLEFSLDIPAAISTQGLLKLKLFRVEGILMDVLSAPREDGG